MIEDLLESIPQRRTNDVIYINPAHPSRVIELNILESVRPEDRPLVVSSVISIMKHLWAENWGPRSEWILENSVYALLEQSAPVTLAALPKLLTDENYRKQILKNVSDPANQDFFRFLRKPKRSTARGMV